MATDPDPMKQRVQQLLRPTGVQLLPMVADSEKSLDAALARVTRDRPDALYPSGTFFNAHRQRIADFALRSRLPYLGVTKEEAEAGALLTYGSNSADLYRRAAGYVDRILKGAKPEDLPVERPNKFDLVINRKTATALGVTISQSVLVQATEVIE
jgi:putative ABC transport system substrate-binding protein